MSAGRRIAAIATTVIVIGSVILLALSLFSPLPASETSQTTVSQTVSATTGATNSMQNLTFPHPPSPFLSFPPIVYGGQRVSVVVDRPLAVIAGGSIPDPKGGVYSFVGSGGDDTFLLHAGSGPSAFLATGLFDNDFIINSSGTGNSTFSLSSGDNSTFVVVEGNPAGGTGVQQFLITGGGSSFLNETSYGPVGSVLWSINLGTDSVVNLGSIFAGNQTEITIVS